MGYTMYVWIWIQGYEQRIYDNFTDRHAYFGEIAGKHSEVCGVVEEDEISITEDAVEFLGDD